MHTSLFALIAIMSAAAASDKAEVRMLSSLSGSALLQAIRSSPLASNVESRRRLTQAVYDEMLVEWKSDSRFRGMAHHLVADVHGGIFRKGFAQIVKDSNPRKVAVAQFTRLNNLLHHHHENEDQSWFPSLIRQHPELKSEVRLLEKDHKGLVALVAQVEGRRPPGTGSGASHSTSVEANGGVSAGSSSSTDKADPSAQYEALLEFVAALEDHLNREEMLTVPFLLDGKGGM